MQELLLQSEINKLKSESKEYLSHSLTDKQTCDLEMILVGGFYPLKGFLNERDYSCVLNKLRLENNSVWPIPITLDISENLASDLEVGGHLTLKDTEGFALAILDIESIYKPDKKKEAEKIFGTLCKSHPGTQFLFSSSEEWYVGGRLRGIMLPKHYDFASLRMTPKEIKKEMSKLGWEKVVGFQTRDLMHRAHVELTNQALKEIDANLLIHPVVGITKPVDVDYFTRVRCYQHILKKYPVNTAMLCLLPLAMRMAGPREALLHALIRKNYGCTHFIVGRDHAGPGEDKDGNLFYGPYEAQELLREFENEISIKMVPFKMVVYVEEKGRYMTFDKVPEKTKTREISRTELKRRLDLGLDLPDWFSYNDVVNELRKNYPEKIKRGFTIFFSGLSGSGKSTLANGLMVKLMEDGRRPVTILDGDVVRKHLSSELGFSKEHRSINIKRIGYVASEITKNGGIAICAPIAPYESDRLFNRNLISYFGGYIEVYLSTPLEVCVQRDTKGLYELARKGKIKEFTGISDPYEIPENPEVVINTSYEEPESLVQKILFKIEQLGYI